MNFIKSNYYSILIGIIFFNSFLYGMTKDYLYCLEYHLDNLSSNFDFETFRSHEYIEQAWYDAQSSERKSIETILKKYETILSLFSNNLQEAFSENESDFSMSVSEALTHYYEASKILKSLFDLLPITDTNNLEYLKDYLKKLDALHSTINDHILCFPYTAWNVLSMKQKEIEKIHRMLLAIDKKIEEKIRKEMFLNEQQVILCCDRYKTLIKTLHRNLTLENTEQKALHQLEIIDELSSIAEVIISKLFYASPFFKDHIKIQISSLIKEHSFEKLTDRFQGAFKNNPLLSTLLKKTKEQENLATKVLFQ